MAKKYQPLFIKTPTSFLSRIIYTLIGIVLFSHGVRQSEAINEPLELDHELPNEIYISPLMITEQQCLAPVPMILHKPLIFSEITHRVIHPGIYMMKNSFKNIAEWQEQQLIFAKARLAANPKLQYIPEYMEQMAEENARELRNTYELDQSYKESNVGDRLAHDVALAWIEKEILPYKFETIDPAEQQKIIMKMNYLLSSEDERDINHDGSRSLYRTQPITINKVPGVPKLTNPDKMVAFLEKNDPDNIPEYIKWIKLQNEYVLKKNKDAGKFFSWVKMRDKNVGKFLDKYILECPASEKIPSLMKEFYEILPKKIKEDPIMAASFAHMEFVKIHPFVGANGRTARALMNVILMQAGLDPIVFLQNKSYSQAVNRAQQENNNSIFEEFLRKEINWIMNANEKLKKMGQEMEECQSSCKPTTCYTKCGTILTQWQKKNLVNKEKNSEQTKSYCTVAVNTQKK